MVRSRHRGVPHSDLTFRCDLSLWVCGCVYRNAQQKKKNTSRAFFAAFVNTSNLVDSEPSTVKADTRLLSPSSASSTVSAARTSHLAAGFTERGTAPPQSAVTTPPRNGSDAAEAPVTVVVSPAMRVESVEGNSSPPPPRTVSSPTRLSSYERLVSGGSPPTKPVASPESPGTSELKKLNRRLSEFASSATEDVPAEDYHHQSPKVRPSVAERLESSGRTILHAPVFYSTRWFELADAGNVGGE